MAAALCRRQDCARAAGWPFEPRRGLRLVGNSKSAAAHHSTSLRKGDAGSPSLLNKFTSGTFAQP